MESSIRWFFDFLIWFFVPVSLIVAVIYTASIFRKVESEKQKAAAKAGFWGGLMLFAGVFVFQVSLYIQNGFPHLELYQGFNIQIAILGALAGFISFLGGRRFVASRMTGWITLILTFLEFFCFFNYLLVRQYNEIVLSAVLGITFGVLAHFALPHEHTEEF